MSQVSHWHIHRGISPQDIELQEALRAELLALEPPMAFVEPSSNTDSHCLNGMHPPNSKQLDSLPLLHAVLMETLRIEAAIPGSQPWVTPYPSRPLGGSKSQAEYEPQSRISVFIAAGLHIPIPTPGITLIGCTERPPACAVLRLSGAAYSDWSRIEIQAADCQAIQNFSAVGCITGIWYTLPNQVLQPLVTEHQQFNLVACCSPTSMRETFVSSLQTHREPLSRVLVEEAEEVKT